MVVLLQKTLERLAKVLDHKLVNVLVQVSVVQGRFVFAEVAVRESKVNCETQVQLAPVFNVGHEGIVVNAQALLHEDGVVSRFDCRLALGI